jgi:thiol-disulfide isomerase/thioredoxin
MLTRRTWLGQTTAAALAAAGWPGPARAAVAPDEPPAWLWQQVFARPDGSTLALAALRGSPLVINFWGTWCAPCVREMPELDHFQRDFARLGWHVVGLAIDNPTAVREFLARRPVGYTIALAGLEGSALARRLGNEQGGLPYTVVLDRAGAVARRKRGPTSYRELADWARAT